MTEARREAAVSRRMNEGHALGLIRLSELLCVNEDAGEVCLIIWVKATTIIDLRHSW